MCSGGITLRQNFFSHYGRQLGTLAGLLVLVVVLWALTPHFLTVSNLLNIAEQANGRSVPRRMNARDALLSKRNFRLVLAALALVGFEFADVSRRVVDARATSSLITTNYGAGLYVLGLAAFAVIVGSLTVRPRTS